MIWDTTTVYFLLCHLRLEAQTDTGLDEKHNVLYYSVTLEVKSLILLLLRDETLEMIDLQARVSIQRTHLGIPAVVVDGVSLCHPQHWTLQERR